MQRIAAIVVTAALLVAACGADTTGEGDELFTPLTTGVSTDSQGEAAPDFTVPLFDGTGFSLAEHVADDGRPVFLNLWASWCIPCREEMPAIDAAAARYPNVLFLGVAVQDDAAAAEEFAGEIGVSYPLGVDERDVLTSVFATFGLPTSYLISGEGILITEVIGEVDEARLDSVISTFLGG